MIMRTTRGLTPLATSNTTSSIIDSFGKLISAKFQLPTSKDHLRYYSSIVIETSILKPELTTIVVNRRLFDKIIDK